MSTCRISTCCMRFVSTHRCASLWVSHDIVPTRCRYNHWFTTAWQKAVFPFSWCTDKVFEGFAVLPFGQILAKICFFLVSLPAVSPWLRKKWLRAERHSAHPVQSSQYAPCKNCDIWERILESISAECRHLLVTVFLKNCSGFLYYNVGIKILANCVKTMGKT